MVLIPRKKQGFLMIKFTDLNRVGTFVESVNGLPSFFDLSRL